MTKKLVEFWIGKLEVYFDSIQELRISISEIKKRIENMFINEIILYHCRLS